MVQKIAEATDLQHYVCKDLNLDVVLQVWLSLEDQTVDAKQKNPTAQHHEISLAGDRIILLFEFNHRRAAELDYIFLGKLYTCRNEKYEYQSLYAYPKNNIDNVQIYHQSKLPFVIDEATFKKGYIDYSESIQRIFSYNEQSKDSPNIYKLVKNSYDGCFLSVSPNLRHKTLCFAGVDITIQSYKKRVDSKIEKMTINFYGKRGRNNVYIQLEGTPDQFRYQEVATNGRTYVETKVPVESLENIQWVDQGDPCLLTANTHRVLFFKNIKKIKEQVIV